MKLRTKQDIMIPAGTEFASDDVPTKTEWGAGNVVHQLAFGPNATGRLFVGAATGDAGFDEWFEQVPEDTSPKRRSAKH